jgi:hypothetical protein
MAPKRGVEGDRDGPRILTRALADAAHPCLAKLSGAPMLAQLIVAHAGRQNPQDLPHTAGFGFTGSQGIFFACECGPA